MCCAIGEIDHETIFGVAGRFGVLRFLPWQAMHLGARLGLMTPEPSRPTRQQQASGAHWTNPEHLRRGVWQRCSQPACSICPRDQECGPQSANLRGQDAEYIVRQTARIFKNGARAVRFPRRSIKSPDLMRNQKRPSTMLA